jgi:hypothetical protein
VRPTGVGGSGIQHNHEASAAGITANGDHDPA